MSKLLEEITKNPMNGHLVHAALSCGYEASEVYDCLRGILTSRIEGIEQKICIQPEYFKAETRDVRRYRELLKTLETKGVQSYISSLANKPNCYV